MTDMINNKAANILFKTVTLPYFILVILPYLTYLMISTYPYWMVSDEKKVAEYVYDLCYGGLKKKALAILFSVVVFMILFNVFSR